VVTSCHSCSEAPQQEVLVQQRAKECRIPDLYLARFNPDPLVLSVAPLAHRAPVPKRGESIVCFKNSSTNSMRVAS
jgi:hypothetical protein